MTTYEYDVTNPRSIESYAKKLIDKTFLDVIREQMDVSDGEVIQLDDERLKSYKNKMRKGGLGNLLEEVYFGYAINSDSKADFSEAGLELKATPYDVSKKGEPGAGERLVLTMISYNSPVEEEFDSSHLWQKCKLLLLIYYWRNKELPSNLLYPIKHVSLFTPPASDLEIIKQDYYKIIGLIKSGNAHELSEGDTTYLGACTKGKTAETSIVNQYYPPHIPAKRRAFCYKKSYMNYVFRNYILQNVDTAESIIKDPQELREQTFEEIVIGRINKYVGQTDKELCDKFNQDYDIKNKSLWINLAYYMLGVKSDGAQEFKKAGITIKAIRLEEDYTMRESSSLPTIKFKELVEEDWETSKLYDYFVEEKFLFVVFHKQGDSYVLKGCQLWHMSVEDLEEVHAEWENVKAIVKNGINFTKVKYGKGFRMINNLPNKTDTRITHIRPHANKSYYDFGDGRIFGSGSISDSDLLPDGRRMTTQSFWLNNTYILSQLEDYLKNP